MADEQGGNDAVVKLLTQMNARLANMEKQSAEDMTAVNDNFTKLATRIQNVEAGGGLAGGVSNEVVLQRLEQISARVEAIDNRPIFARNAKEREERYKAALKREGELEKSGDVHIMWHPELDDAKREVGPLCRKVRGAADIEEARALGYFDTIDQAAEQLFKNEKAREAADAAEFKRLVDLKQPAAPVKKARFASPKAARIALHNAEQRFAKAQVASIAPGQPGALAVQQAGAA